MLRRVAGFQIIPDRDEWVFAVRGNVSDNNQKYLVLIDGHRMNSNENFGPGQIIEMPNDLSSVKRLEIIRGPGSAVWGPDALAGVINIITKDASDLGENTFHSRVTVGDNDTYKANFQVGERLGEEADLILMGAVGSDNGTRVTQSAATQLPILEEESGFDSHPFGTYTTSLDDHEPGYTFHGKARVKDFKLSAFLFNTETHNRHFEVDQGRENFLTTEKWFVEAAYGKVVGDNIDFDWKLAVDSNNAQYQPKQGQALFIEWKDRKVSSNIDVGVPLADDFDLKAGVEYVYTEFGPNTRVNNLDAEDPSNSGDGFLFDEERDENAAGGYAMLAWSVTDDFDVHAGGRYDFNDTRGDDEHVFNPRFAAVWQAAEETTLKALYNRGFLRPANFQTAGETVESETMDQVDLVILQQLGKASLSTTLYWQRLEGFISIVSIAEESSFANTGDYESKGIEVELMYPLGDKSSIWGNVSYSDAEAKNFPEGLALNARRIKPDGTLLSYAPLTANFGATWYLSETVYISPAVRFVGETDYRATPPTDSIEDATYDTKPDFYFVDLNVAWHITENVHVNVYADNVLDENDPTHLTVWNGTVEQYGRYVEGRLKFLF